MVRNSSSLPEVPKLIVQPSDLETRICLASMGFEPVPEVPQLLYLVMTNRQATSAFIQMSRSLSEMSQTMSRFILTRSPLDLKTLLIEFLQAEPLSAITLSVKHAWFLQVLTQQRLFFKYQPIFDLASGNVAAYECLACAQGEQERYFSGQQLIDAALSMQLAHEFDELARITCLEAVAELTTNVTALENHPSFFINVLPNALSRNPGFLAQNCEKALELGLRPQQIVFELTEVEALVQCPELLKVIGHLRDLGFGLAIDDFCGAVSVDHYLMELQPDVIKLDKRLVKGCGNYTMKQILIKALLYSAHELDILVLAEGLEDSQDIEFCRNSGVDYGQGYGLARPDRVLQPEPLNLIQFPMSSRAS